MATALALAGFALSASAQTNVTLYGLLDASVEYARYSAGQGANGATPTPGGSAVRVQPGVSSGSRWGITGTEDLGGGLKAIFTLEAGISNDTGGFQTGGSTGIGFGRRSFVGVQSNSLGLLYFGRDYTPAFWTVLNADRMGRALYGNAVTITQQSNNDMTRISNGLFYISPRWAGFQVRATVGAGNENFGSFTPATATTAAVASPQSQGRFAGISADYTLGGLYVGAAYQQRRDLFPTATSLANTGNSRFAAVGAMYTFGAFSINGGASQYDPVGANTATVGKIRGYWVGGSAKIGAGDLLLQAGQTTVDLANVTDPRARTYGAAYTYPMSKRTTLYAAYGTTRNSRGARFNLDTGDSPNVIAGGGVNSSPSAFAVGIRHTF